MTRKWMALAILPAVAGMTLAGCSQRKSAAELEFERVLGRTSVTFFPTVVHLGKMTQIDWDSSRTLAAEFERRGLGKAALREEVVGLKPTGSMNQAKMYQQSKAAFADYVKAHPPATEYAAIAEYLCAPDGQVGGIHMYLARADGQAVGGVLLNSHWKEYKAVQPKSVPDATRALLLRLENQWQLPAAPPAR